MALNRAVLGKVLRAAAPGVAVVEAADGWQAYEAFRSCGGTATFGLVLMDLQMPVCDGWTAASHMRALEINAAWPAARIWACTTEDLSPGSTALARCWDAGFDGAVVSLGWCMHRGRPERARVLACAVLPPAPAAAAAATHPLHRPPALPQGKALPRDVARQLLQGCGPVASAFAAASEHASTGCSLSELQACGAARSASSPLPVQGAPLGSPRSSLDSESGSLPDRVRQALANSLYRCTSV